jgi:hypothetical protein
MTDISSQSMSGVEDPGRLACRLMQHAHNRDGLPEIVVGALSLLVSALMTGLLYTRHGSILQEALALVMAVLIPAMGLAGPGIIKWLRRRYLMARAGYFESRPSRARGVQIAVGIASGIAAALGAVIVARHGMMPPNRWLLAGTGVFGGLAMALCGRSTRFAVGGLLMALAGVSIGFSGVSLTAGFALFFGSTGAMALVSGVVILLQFMRETTESRA